MNQARVSPAFPATAVSPGATLGLPHLQQPMKEADSSMIFPGCDARVNQMSSGFGPWWGAESLKVMDQHSTLCPMVLLPYKVSPENRVWVLAFYWRLMERSDIQQQIV